MATLSPAGVVVAVTAFGKVSYVGARPVSPMVAAPLPITSVPLVLPV